MMSSTTDHVTGGWDQTTEALNHETEQGADTSMDAARPAGHTRQDAGRLSKTPKSRGHHLRGGPMDGGGHHRRARRVYAEPV